MILDIIPKLVSVLRQPRIILIPLKSDSEFIIQAVNGGAMGIVFATQKPEVIYKAIEKVHAGEVWLDRSLIANLLTQNIQIRKKG